MKFTKILALSGAAALLTATAATAQVTDISSMANQAGGQLKAIGTLAGLAASLMGAVFAIMGLLKLKANQQNPNDPSNKVSSAFMLIFIGAALIAIPTVLGVGVNSLFGQGAATAGGGISVLQ